MLVHLECLVNCNLFLKGIIKCFAAHVFLVSRRRELPYFHTDTAMISTDFLFTSQVYQVYLLHAAVCDLL